MAKKRFQFGPWRGSYRASEPFVPGGELARLMVNGYVPDPQNGAGFYSRPGIVNPAEVTSGSKEGQGIVSHTTDAGTPYNFVIANGRVWRWSTNLNTTITDVTPSNIQIDPDAKQVYGVGYADGVVFNDGKNNPWYATNLGSTPITGTHIPYVDNSVQLSRGSGNDRQIANTAGRFILNGTGTGYTATETALPAGTIPANQWGIYRVTVSNLNVKTVTAGAANYTTGYASEAAAIAALPNVPANQYDLGYFTVLTAVGNPFIAGTDALQGGATGNPSSDTNYYAGSPASPWLAFGQPVIYAGSVFFVAQLLNTTDVYDGDSARSSIVWAEPNFPLVGYRQTGYDNLWELTQTSTEPIFALAGTNDLLYYFRAYSIGAVSGTPGINFQGTATHDVVSGNVGCVAPKSIRQFLNYLYFSDQFGRPWRLAIGGNTEAIWLQAREVFEDTAVLVDEDQWAVIEPNLNLYLLKFTGSSVFVWDARSGAYFGTWTENPSFFDVSSAGNVYNNNGTRFVAFLRVDGNTPSNPIEVDRLTLVSEATWTDTAGPFALILQTPYQGFDTDELQTPTAVMALAEIGNAAGVLAATGTVYTMNGTAPLSSYTPQALASGVDGIGRYVWNVGSSVQGRGVRVQLSFVPTTNQVKLYRISVDSETSSSSIYDR